MIFGGLGDLYLQPGVGMVQHAGHLNRIPRPAAAGCVSFAVQTVRDPIQGDAVGSGTPTSSIPAPTKELAPLARAKIFAKSILIRGRSLKLEINLALGE